MTNEGDRSRIIREQIDTRTIDALMSNYRDPQQALMDIVDNAVDNRIEGQPLTVRVRVSGEEISVSNQGGEGLDLEGLHNYFTWGRSEKLGKIGQFGVGGKAAMGYLGRGMEIVCSAQGSDKEYTVSDENWENRSEGLKQLEAQEGRATDSQGYFRVKMSGLKRNVNASNLAAKLGDIYRPLLLDGSVEMTLNGKRVEPIDIKYMASDPNLAPQIFRIQTRLGDKVDVKLGVLEENQRNKPGIRLYYRGRLIRDGEFFGLPGPAQIPGTSRLIGEAYLDVVPVTANKSDFDRGSVQWQTVAPRIKNQFEPWIEKAKGLKPNQESPVEKHERDLATRAKRVLEHVMADTGILTIKDIPGAAVGRLPSRGPREPRPESNGTHRSPEGKTAPRLESLGEKVKRWGLTHEVDIRSMGNDELRSTIIDRDGKKVLVINSDYPIYQAMKIIGEDAHQIYMVETMVHEVCREVVVNQGSESIADYTDMVNRITAACGRILRSRLSEKRGGKR